MAEWRKSEIDGGPPYKVWKALEMDWWAVLDRNGVNVLTNGTGSVFVGSEEEARELAREWNGEKVTT